jgi:arylsulfatase
MIERWWVEAATTNILPLDDREYERAAANVTARARRTYTYYPGMARIDRLNAPDITDRSHRIAADVEIPAGGAEGVLLTSGNRFAGYVLYVKDGRLVYEYAYSETVRHTVRSAIRVPEGRRTLGFAFVKTATRQGQGTLLIDDQPVGSIELPKTWPVIATTGGVHCGRDGGLPVTDAYTPPFPFTGTLHQVRVELSEDGRSDPSVEARGSLAEE